MIRLWVLLYACLVFHAVTTSASATKTVAMIPSEPGVAATQGSSLKIRDHESYSNLSSAFTMFKREHTVRPMLLLEKSQRAEAANDLVVSGSSFAFIVVLTLAAFMF